MKEKFMYEAIKQAKKSYKRNEVPVGCVIEKNGKIISKAHNLKETKKNSLAHAEIIAINQATKKLKNWRLYNCNMYVTMEPCCMCAGAIKQARLKKVYYGVPNDNSLCRKILNKEDNNKKVEIEGNVLSIECKELIQTFFKKQRKHDF